MKFSVLACILIFTLLSFAEEGKLCTVYNPCAQERQETGENVYETPYSTRRHGFYMDVSLTAAYSSFYGKFNYGKFNSVEKEYSGIGPATSFKFGFSPAPFAALYGNIDFEPTFDGTYKENGIKSSTVWGHKRTNKSSRFLAGPGATLFPIIDPESPFDGFFIGGSVGLVLSGAAEEFDEISLGLRLETGKLWRVSTNTMLGIVLHASVDDAIVDDAIEDHLENDLTIYSIGIGFKIARK